MIYSKKLKTFKLIKHCFFTRKGGFSKGIYKSLNCGKGSRDKKKNILKNLGLVSKIIGVRKENLILMHQTHSNRVTKINNTNKRKKINADAMITNTRGLALAVVTADCVPILIYDKENGIVGCIHAGWRGAIADIIKKTIIAIKKLNKKNRIYASIGPCIGKKSYEVDTKFFKNFTKKSKKNKIYFSKKNKNKLLFNLRKFVADKLLVLRVSVDHINRDTFKDKNNFFSYRRSTILKQRDYGRCISVIRVV